VSGKIQSSDEGHGAMRPLGIGLVVIGGPIVAVAMILGPSRLGVSLSIIGSLMLILGTMLWLHYGMQAPKVETVERAVRESIDRNLAGSIELSRDYRRLGLVQVHGDCTALDYGPIITESRRLVAVLNDGRTWASVHRDRLRRRLVDPNKDTTFILIHPDSPMVEVLARKGSKDVETIRVRIRDTVQLLEEIKGDNTSLEILGHWLFNPYSLVIGDDTAIVAPYFISRGGRTVPAFVYRDVGPTSHFRDLLKDVERLRMDTKDISSRPRNTVRAEVVKTWPKGLEDHGT